MVAFCTEFIVKLLGATCGAVFVSVVGHNTLAYQLLAILVCIDLITDLMVAHEYQTSYLKRFRVVISLSLYFLLVLAVHQIVRYEPSFQIVEDTVVMFFLLSELKTIMVNVRALGIDVPTGVFDKVKQFIDEYGKKKK
jgi:phage-related holin